MSELLVFSPAPPRSLAAYRLANLLVRLDIPVRWALERMVVAGQPVPRGAFVVPLADLSLSTSRSDDDAAAVVDAAARRLEVDLVRGEAKNGLLAPLGVPRIGVYGGGGAPYNYARIFAELGFVTEFVDPQAIRCGALAEFDVLAVPGGGQFAMQGQLDPLGAEGCLAVAHWVRDGGMYIGSCAGAFDAAITSDSFIATCPQQSCLRLINARVWNSGDREWAGLESPGVGVVRARTLHPDHPVMFNLPEEFEITHYNGPLFETVPGTLPGASTPVGLASIVGWTDRFTPAECFLNFSREDALAPAADRLLARAIEAGTYNVVAGHLDLGRVVLFGSHPEFGLAPTAVDYDLPAIMLANCAFWESGGRPRRVRSRFAGAVLPVSMNSAIATASTILDRIALLLGDLTRRSVDPTPRWLDESHALSLFGRSGREIWLETMAAFGGLTSEVREAIGTIERAIDDTMRAIQADGAGRGDDWNDVRAMLQRVAKALVYRPRAEWRQDFGYEGLIATLERCEQMIRKALAGWDLVLDPPRSTYEHFESSPFHLVAGSYIAGAGIMINALHLIHALGAELEMGRLHAELRGATVPL